MFAVAVSNAAAAEDGGYMEAYRQYNEALESGDPVAAATYGKQAWLAAEETLGDDQTTAVLGYNYASLVYESEPAAAMEPLARVVALIGEEHEMFGAEHPGMMLLFVRASANPDDGAARKELRDTLKKKEAAGLAPSIVAALSWRLFAYEALERSRLGRLKDYAGHAERHFTGAAAVRHRHLAEVLILQGIGLISGKNRSTGDIEEAFVFFDRSIDLFPAQESIDDFDDLLAVALAWYAGARAAAMSDYELKSTGTRIRNRMAEDSGVSLVRWAGAPSGEDDCERDWDDREKPKFPDRELNRGLLGAVLIGYDISEEGLVINERILAEVPTESAFGVNALDVVGKWRLSAPAPAECRSNVLTTFNFIIK